MKYILNICCLLLLGLTLSSVAKAQTTKRPSQRAFAVVLQKIKEKQENRKNMLQQQSPQGNEKVEAGAGDVKVMQYKRIHFNTALRASPDKNRLASMQGMREFPVRR